MIHWHVERWAKLRDVAAHELLNATPARLLHVDIGPAQLGEAAAAAHLPRFSHRVGAESPKVRRYLLRLAGSLLQFRARTNITLQHHIYLHHTLAKVAIVHAAAPASAQEQTCSRPHCRSEDTDPCRVSVQLPMMTKQFQ